MQKLKICILVNKVNVFILLNQINLETNIKKVIKALHFYGYQCKVISLIYKGDRTVLNNEDFENEIQEEESNIIVLTDDEGNDVEFEFLDVIEYEGIEYIVIIPTDEEASEVVILKIENVDDETENYVGIDDEEVLNAVFNIFKDRYSDEFNFSEQEDQE